MIYLLFISCHVLLKKNGIQMENVATLKVQYWLEKRVFIVQKFLNQMIPGDLPSLHVPNSWVELAVLF